MKPNPIIRPILTGIYILFSVLGRAAPTNPISNAIFSGANTVAAGATFNFLNGKSAFTNIAAPATPASGIVVIYTDSTSKNFAAKNDAGTVNHGIQTRTATGSNWIRSILDDGTTTISQPAFTDISGSVVASQLPNPSSSTLGGVQSIAAVSHNFLTAISTSGSPAQAQPAASDLSNGTTGSGNVTLSPGGLTVTTGKVLTVTNNLTLSGTDGVTMTTPATSFTAARTDAAQTFTGNQTFSSAPISTNGIFTAGGAGTGGTSYGSVAPILLYVKSVTILTAGTPADIATITIPAGFTRYCTSPNNAASGGLHVLAETASGTLNGASFTARDTASGAGTAMSSAATGPTASGLMTAASNANGNAVLTTGTIYINQTLNSANAGTCSFYILIVPIP